MGARIVSIGFHLPPVRVSNEMWRTQFATKHEVMSNEFTRFISEGIEQRYYWEPGTKVADVSARAAIDCLQRADFSPEKVEHILHATNVSDAFVNGDGPKVQHAIGARHASSMDITGVSCTAFIVALGTAVSHIDAGRYGNVLISCVANTGTRAADHCDVAGSSLGDLAVSVLLEKTNDDSGLVSYCHETSGEHYELHRHKLVPEGKRTWEQDRDAPWGSHFFYIDPRRGVQESTKVTHEFVPGAARKALARAGKMVADMKWFVSHQPGAAAMKVWDEAIGIDPSKHANTLAEVANASFCTIPFTLNRLLERAQIEKGDYLLLLAPGSGYHAASAVWKW